MGVKIPVSEADQELEELLQKHIHSHTATYGDVKVTETSFDLKGAAIALLSHFQAKLKEWGDRMTDELKGKLIDIVGRIKVAEVVGHSIREERFATEIIALFRKAGWVEKDKDQRLPEWEGPYEAGVSYRNGQEALIALGWVKVKKEWGL